MINDVETLVRIQADRYNDYVQEAAGLRLAQLVCGGAQSSFSGRPQRWFAVLRSVAWSFSIAQQERAYTGLSTGLIKE